MGRQQNLVTVRVSQQSLQQVLLRVEPLQCSHCPSVIRLYALSLELFDDLCRHVRENLIYVEARLRRSFEETQAVLLGQSSTSSRIYFLFIFRAVCLVSNEYFLDVRYRMLVYLFEPILNVVESHFLGAIVH